MRRSLPFAIACLAAFASVHTGASAPAPERVEMREGAAAYRHASRRVHPATSTRPQSRRWHGAPISLSLKNADLRDVLRSFAKLGGFNLVLDPTVKGEVTLEFENVPWDQALHMILKVNGLAAEIDGRIWTVEPISTAIERARQ